MRTGFTRSKRGFTLVETVVTVGIVAALAAVVYPTVVKQFDAADPTRDPWQRQAYRSGGLVDDDLVVLCLPGPAGAAEVFVVSDDSEGFGQISRTFDSLHESAEAADARIEALDEVASMFPHQARRRLAPLDVLLSDAEEDQPDFCEDADECPDPPEPGP